MLSNLEESGFTLIEILVSVAIVGMLVAIAVPEFKEYKQKANDALAIVQIKNMATALEANTELYDLPFTNISIFPDGSVGGGLLSGEYTLNQVVPGFVHQKGVYIFMNIFPLSQHFDIAASHCKGTPVDDLGVFISQGFSFSGNFGRKITKHPVFWNHNNCGGDE